MKTVYFISDAHLGFDDPETESIKRVSLIDFLEHVGRDGGILFILGDLFNFWFEYKSVIPRRYTWVLTALQRLKARNVEIHYLTGNHDFWLDSFFQEELGVQVHRDPVDMSLGGKRFWIAHGDGIMKKDVRYRLMKRILRHPVSITLYRLLHPELAFGLAHFCTKLSRNHHAFPDNEEDYIARAEALFSEGYDCVVMAHTHQPRILGKRGRTYVNTGDWMRHFTFSKLEKGRLTLERWPVKNRFLKR